MIKYLIHILLVLFIFSCEEFIPEVGDPQVTIQGIDNFDTSTINLSWEGNEYAFGYSYRLEPTSYLDTVRTYIDWSDWSTDTMITLQYLDEGNYNFYVKSRFNVETEQTVATKITFEVNAIQNTALRIYPLRKQVNLNNSFYVYVYAENIPNFVAAKIELQYISSILEYKSSSSGCGILESNLPDEQTDGIITKLYCDFSGNYNTSDPLFQLEFTRIGNGDTEINILESSMTGDNTGNYYGVDIRKSGRIEGGQ